MDNPPVKKDLLDSILELRAEAEHRLMRNKYYVAVKKLDELLDALRPLDAEVIDEQTRPAAEPAAIESASEHDANVDELFASEHDAPSDTEMDDEWSVPGEPVVYAPETFDDDGSTDAAYAREVLSDHSEEISASDPDDDAWEHPDDYEHDTDAADSRAA